MTQSWHVPDDDLRDYAAGRLTVPVLWSVESHVMACSTCRDALTVAAGPRPPADGWARLDASLDAPVPGPIERLLLGIRVPDHTARLLAATPALRMSWLIAVTLTVLLMAGLAQLVDPFVFLAAAPLLPLLGVAVSFGPGVDPTYELALVAPTNAFRLLLLRCVAVVSANSVLCAAASLSTPSLGLGMAGWFLPSLALTVITLLLAPRLGTIAAASVVGVGWTVLVISAAGAAFTPGGQFAAALTFTVAAVLLSRRATAFDTNRFPPSRRTR